DARLDDPEHAEVVEARPSRRGALEERDRVLQRLRRAEDRGEIALEVLARELAPHADLAAEEEGGRRFHEHVERVEVVPDERVEAVAAIAVADLGRHDREHFLVPGLAVRALDPSAHRARQAPAHVTLAADMSRERARRPLQAARAAAADRLA